MTNKKTFVVLSPLNLNNMSGKKGDCEDGAHLISREGRPEAQVSVSEKLDEIQKRRKTVRKTGRKPVRAKRGDIAIAKIQDRSNTNSKLVSREQFELLILLAIATSRIRKLLKDKTA